MSDIAKDLLDTFEALQQENEQLRAQVARLREVIIEKTDKLKKIFNKMNYTGMVKAILDKNHRQQERVGPF